MYTLDEVVRMYMIEAGEADAKYYRFLQIAWAGLEEMNMDVSGISTVTELTIDQNTMRANLPEDFIQYNKIGVCINGKVVPLGIDNTLCLDKNLDSCGNQVAIPVCNTPEFVLFPNLPGFESAGWNGGLFGVGGGNNINGYYRIDQENGQILFASPISGTIVLEYLASPQKQKGEYVVHPYSVESVKAWIAWVSIRSLKGVGLGDVQTKRAEYYNQKRLANQRFRTWTLDELYQTMRKSNYQAPKY